MWQPLPYSHAPSVVFGPRVVTPLALRTVAGGAVPRALSSGCDESAAFVRPGVRSHASAKPFGRSCASQLRSCWRGPGRNRDGHLYAVRGDSRVGRLPCIPELLRLGRRGEMVRSCDEGIGLPTWSTRVPKSCRGRVRHLRATPKNLCAWQTAC